MVIVYLLKNVGLSYQTRNQLMQTVMITVQFKDSSDKILSPHRALG